jgi:hypothetical protein
MRLLALIAAAALATGAQAEPLVIRAGEAVTLSVGKRGKVTEVSRTSAPTLTPFEAAGARHLASGELDWAVGANSAPILSSDPAYPEPDPIERGVVRIKLVALDAKHMLLVLRNGYGRRFKYRAVLRRGDRTSPTDVCEVHAGKYGLEHWPYPFDSVEISAVRMTKDRPGPPVCE